MGQVLHGVPRRVSGVLDQSANTFGGVMCRRENGGNCDIKVCYPFMAPPTSHTDTGFSPVWSCAYE